jgi:hypothetical protein
MALAAVGMSTWSSFSGTAVNPANSFAAGSVTISDDDNGSALFNLSGLKPGPATLSCIRVTYSGSVPGVVRLRASTPGTGLAGYLQLVVRRGTIGAGAFGSCTGFVADAADYAGDGAGVVYSDPLSAFPADWNGGTDDPHVWRTGETHTYQFELTLANDPAAQGLTADPTFTWESRNASYDASSWTIAS